MLSRKGNNVFFKLSHEGESLLYKAYCLIGEYSFSFYDDDQSPFSNVPERVNIECIKKGFNIEIGMLFHVSD